MLPSFLIGLREGLEAALVVGILVAYMSRIGRRDLLPRMWAGVVLAIVLSLALGAILTFGAYTLSFTAQEVIGGVLSLLAVAMVTWMIFWMQRAGRTMTRSLQGGVDDAVREGSLWAIVVLGFVSVAREGIETTLFLWAMVRSFGDTPGALIGAVLGISAAAVAGWLIAKGAVRLSLRGFFTWTAAFLIVVAAGVLAYAVHDLQEAAVLPGPFSGAAPVDPDTGTVLVGWGAVPFGWAFDVSSAVPPGSALAHLLQGLIGFMPLMSWLQVIAWGLYTAIVGGLFFRNLLRSAPRQHPAVAPETVSPDGAESPSPITTESK
ncbi:iron uptake transporter permease EfeU [Microbacterium sp. SLBN-146]|uniref:iron uptake transporter permease EfeU n=1 Tax=Microbacterium sp. SLBN-146 TaxID=2768457 RepID=UPI0011506814|nr:iron uptake transporter permease EfeU [Microbacterium sp. SLBN-146]TQJ31891.1 high-affinity iron transporter [Microbacterium sp. SLBN-146]